MARRVPKKSLTRRNNPALATRRAPCTPGMPCSSNCWWTESGWLCCITGDTPWPKCRAGGIITPGGGGLGYGAGRLANPLPADVLPVAASPAMPPPGASAYVVAPNGAYPGASAWRYTVGVAVPTLVRIDQIFNDQSGVYARVSTQIANQFWASPTGGFGEVLAPFSQGSSVITSQGAPARMVNQAKHGTGPSNYAAPMKRTNPACMVDMAALTLHCPGSPLHGIAVTDVEGGDGEGELVAASYVDPRTGVEVVGEFLVAPDQGVPWWEHDGHCCESCALGDECDDCEAA